MTNQNQICNQYEACGNTSAPDNSSKSQIDESIYCGIASKKKQMIFNQILRTKKNLIENLRADNFPVPKARKI